MTAKDSPRPYRPSWIDRFTDWVGTLPAQPWISYLFLGIVLIVIQFLFLWLDDGLHAGELAPVIVFNGLATPFLLGLTHLYDKQAATALDSMRPALEMTEPEFDEFHYKLSNMPSPAPLVAGLTLLVLVLGMEQVSAVPSRYAALAQMPVFRIVFHLIDKSSAFMYGVIIYHTIRQLRLVDTINSSYLRLSLLNAGPSQAFSRLTASTAVGLTVGVVAWLLINPDLLSSPLSVGFTAGFTVLAAAVFVWPLYGVHRLMQREKERMLHEIDLRFEAVFAVFNQLLHDGDYDATERLNGTIASLEIERRRISDIPTWPWRAETARIALTAIALPLILMILQTFVLRALDR